MFGPAEEKESIMWPPINADKSECSDAWAVPLRMGLGLWVNRLFGANLFWKSVTDSFARLDQGDAGTFSNNLSTYQRPSSSKSRLCAALISPK